MERITSPRNDDDSIEQQIKAKGLTGRRVTPDQIKALAARVTYIMAQPPGTTSTFCHAYLDGNFSLATGHSACVVKENFNQEIGERIARADAEAQVTKKLWELEGYRLYMELNNAIYE